MQTVWVRLTESVNIQINIDLAGHSGLNSLWIPNACSSISDRPPNYVAQLQLNYRRTRFIGRTRIALPKLPGEPAIICTVMTTSRSFKKQINIATYQVILSGYLILLSVNCNYRWVMANCGTEKRSANAISEPAAIVTLRWLGSTKIAKLSPVSATDSMPLRGLTPTFGIGNAGGTRKAIHTSLKCNKISVF